MRFLIVNDDYPVFLHWLYSQHTGLEERLYAEQMQARNQSLYGQADFYSVNLCKLGHEASDIYVNNERMQIAWAKEHDLPVGRPYEWRFRMRRRIVPWINRVASKLWLYKILAAQIRHYRPDVFLNLEMSRLPTNFFKQVKDYIKLSIGWAEPPALLREQDWHLYDLVIGPSEGIVDHFRKAGLRSELVRYAFEPTVLSKINSASREEVPVTFVGSLDSGAKYSTRYQLLEALHRRIGEALFVWAPSINQVPSGIRERYQGPAWGRHLYEVLSNSKIVVNCHIDVAGEFADNMRLYEATGIGSLLVTDQKKNLNRIFDLGNEVIAYRDPEECIQSIEYYLRHDDDRRSIAAAGQARTLRHHTYYQRMQELTDIVRQYL